MLPLLLRVPEACEALGLSRETIRQLLVRGELEAVRFGSAVRITRSSIEALIKRRTGASAKAVGAS